jgi:divalent metal cation (Fe/Co/Zn/Cd) transporter
MPSWLIALYLLHIGAAFYWLGSSFLVAQAKGKGAEKQFAAQMIAAAMTLALGAVLWREMHPFGIGKMEAMLGLGAACAFAAAGVQGAWVGGSLRRLRKGLMTDAAARKRITFGHRIASVLLAVALLCMVGSYHV